MKKIIVFFGLLLSSNLAFAQHIQYQAISPFGEVKDFIVPPTGTMKLSGLKSPQWECSITSGIIQDNLIEASLGCSEKGTVPGSISMEIQCSSPIVGPSSETDESMNSLIHAVGKRRLTLFSYQKNKSGKFLPSSWELLFTCEPN